MELAEDEGAVGEDLVAPHQELGAGTHLAPVDSVDRYEDLFQDTNELLNDQVIIKELIQFVVVCNWSIVQIKFKPRYLFLMN